MLHIADEHMSAVAHHALYSHVERVGGVEGEDYVFGRRAEEIGEGNSRLKDLFGAHHSDLVRAAPCIATIV